MDTLEVQNAYFSSSKAFDYNLLLLAGFTLGFVLTYSVNGLAGASVCLFRLNLKQKRQVAGIYIALFAMKLVVTNDAPTTHTRSVMGLKKRRLARSGAASRLIIATKDQQLGKPCKVR
jgi:cytochrome c biogenesis protein CcdA